MELNQATTSADFYAHSTEEQVRVMENLARQALASWGLADADIWLLKYRENCVFGVRDEGTNRQYALRIHRHAYHSELALHSELQWMEALNASGIHTPEVVHSLDGNLQVVARVDDVPEARACDLLGWVSGDVLGNIEGGGAQTAAEVRENYRLAGEIAAKIHNQAQGWELPQNFERPVMDGKGLVGTSGYLGDFRVHPGLSEEQLNLLQRAADTVARDLEAFGKTPDRFGLTHADFLPENLLIDNGDIRIIDFDDCGFGWYIMDIATALFFLLGEEEYDPALQCLVQGYRAHRDLPEEHLDMLPACHLARALAYVAWTASRQETETAKELSSELIESAVALAEDYLR